jgi:hypothetical protein
MLDRTLATVRRVRTELLKIFPIDGTHGVQIEWVSGYLIPRGFVQYEEPTMFDIPLDKPPKDAVQAVFDRWVELCRPRHRVRPVLSPERQRKIVKALELYGLDICLAAVEGVTSSEWHMGRNPSAKEYNDITLILRDAKHIEMFAERKKNAREEFLDES